MRTRVGIIGAGPAGLMLAHLLAARGIDSVVLENRDRAYVEQRVRAGVLEHPTVQVLRELGLGKRMDAEGLPHHGFALRFDGTDHRIALTELTGKSITVYGQQEVVKDLIAARLADDRPIEFGVSDVTPHGLDTDAPWIGYTDADGVARELHCEVIAGCDGFHGVSRSAIPAGVLRTYEHAYPHSWLGVLAETPPSSDELIYTHHERGFALHSMRSERITRLYLQVDNDTDIADWSDDRIWAELSQRLAVDGEFHLREGPVLEKSVTAMRSFVVEPMSHGRLFLAGDAAHIVPPTGAKGMNLAVADVVVLDRALGEFFDTGATARLESYSDTCLRRVWRAEHFSWWMTTMLHRVPGEEFAHRLQLSQLRHIAGSESAARDLAENYVGLPHDTGGV